MVIIYLRKALGTFIVWVLGVVVSKVVEMTIFHALLESPYRFYVLALLIAFTVLIWWPEIWGQISPTERILHQGDNRVRQKKHADARAMLNHIRQLPLRAKNIMYDPVNGSISGTLRPPHTWRDSVVRRADWLANHRVLPVWACLWIGQRLGYKLKEGFPSRPLVSEEPDLDKPPTDQS